MAEKRKSTRVAFQVIALLLLLALAVMLRDLLIFGFFSIILAVAMSYPTRLLTRGMPRGLAVMLVLIVGVGAATGLLLLALPTISEQVHAVLERMPDAVNRLQGWAEHARLAVSRSGGLQVGNLTQKFGDSAVQGLESVVGGLIPAAKGIAVLLTTVFLMIVMGAFLAYQPDVYRRSLRALVPRKQLLDFDEYYAVLSRGLSRWLGGIAVSMVLMGTLTAVGLCVAGIQNWALLGLLTMIATFIPYLGALASAVPGLLLALAQSPRHFFYAMIVYLGVHICEGYIVEPMVMKRAVNLPPATLLFGETALGILFGIPGIAIAAPLLVVIKITVQVLYEKKILHKPIVVERAAA